ncbi:MAG: hypothetical protein A2Z86_00440 [Candidatus Glassbacteria bacterium GWA2_58_10]|uniref:Fibronectin type-III domain-containing protein n=1 Tax=Candidatus Glassbacteria bacterium GWA2_58_10 TaxID=1817865 RepID=A0A1F5YEJ4_9BACT|nr:MAG: hypothetical protein A2Z86_00440 [Candidatus Glassbacteria bacterium GWA2_58_10]
MPGLRVMLFSALLAAIASFSSLKAGEVKTFSREIAADKDEFIIEVEGTLDPQNIEITIENLGSSPVVDPRISVNDKYDWYDVNSIAAEATRECLTDQEKALGVWEWILFKRFQLSPRDRSALSPVRGMNGYGYGNCGFCSAWLKALCTAAGVKTRIQEIWGHTVNEVFYDSQWHYLDSNCKVYYLGADNRSFASLAELEHNPGLVQRTIHSHDPWVRQPDSLARSKVFIDYICTWGDNYIDDHNDDEIAKNYTMSYTLKQGETLIRWWGPELGKYESAQRRAPQQYANGRLIWEPDLDKVDVLPYLRVIDNVTTVQQDNWKPAIHCARLQNENMSRPSRFTIPITSPYPIVGGNFSCRLVKEGDSKVKREGNPRDYAGVCYGSPDFYASRLGAFREGKGTLEVKANLDSSMARQQPLYNYEIGFSLSGNADARPVTQSGVEHFKAVTDLQVSPHSLPALARGRNLVKYRDSNPEAGKKVRLTWKYCVVDTNSAPLPPAAAVSPVVKGSVSSLTPLLRWQPARDPDEGDSVTDYQVMISLFPRCRWPLGSSLHRNTGSNVPEWSVPEGFLNSGVTYYWKVRARDSRRAVGEWSEVFSFKTAENAE